MITLDLRILTIVFLMPTLIIGCSDMCKNTIVNETSAPGGKLKLIEFVRDCGATTGLSTQVSLIELSAKVENDGGNLLILGDHSNGAPLNDYGGVEIEAQWIDSNLLILKYSIKVEVIKSIQKLEGVTIKYQPY